jgi:hypothetical protein
MVKEDLKEHTIRKFKGINASRQGTSFEATGLKDEELVDVVNWNITSEGNLEKRYGTVVNGTITTPSTPLRLRLLFTQRILPDIPAQPFFIVTDGTRTWRMNAAQNGGYAEYTVPGGAPISNMQWFIEQGGTSSPSAYQINGIRGDAGHTITIANGGLLAISPGSFTTSTFFANTPPGTHMTWFKQRLWVVNSYGGDSLATPQTAGDETRVWFSSPTSAADFGGVGAPNNFNLEHGDGDYLVASIPYNDQLLFFKTRRTYIANTSGDPVGWTYRNISDHIGCVGRGTIKLIDGKIYFLSTEGVVRTDGSQAELISDNITNLLETYRDFKQPQTVMDIYASYYRGKYILWLPRITEVSIGDNALVFDLATETWTTWRLYGGVSCFGEARLADKWGDALYMGSWSGNRMWRLSKEQWTDNGTAYPASFQTKKINMDSPMANKRNYLIGLTVKDESPIPGSYTVSTKADDGTPTASRTEAPSRTAVVNIKAPGGGYGKYFQTTVTQTSVGYAAVYDISWVNEEKGLEPYSAAGGARVSMPPNSNVVWTLGPGPQSTLNFGYRLGL